MRIYSSEKKQSMPTKTKVSMSLGANIAQFERQFEHCDDLVFHRITINETPVCYIFLSELVNEQFLHRFNENMSPTFQSIEDIEEAVHRSHLITKIEKYEEIEPLFQRVLSGKVVLFVDGFQKAFVFNAAGYKTRFIEEPTNEQVVRGPRDGFIEDIHTNLNLIRRKLKSANLKVESLTLGTETNTEINVLYLKGIADDEIVQEVRDRLLRIEIDGILESQYIESMISDSRWSPFPTVYSTERPDKVCGDLLDGKVAILTDGTPFALTVPALFVEFLHSSADYYNSSLSSTLVRWIRFLGLFVTMILPAFFVALITFHQDLLQTPLLIRLAANREGLPYPALIEAIFLLITYELLREAGLRMSRHFGGSIVTILGLVIVGQAAVQAGIIGAVMAIVITVSALTSFILPSYSFHQVIRFTTIPLLILGGVLGFLGILVGLMFGLAHLVSLRSFGVPYFTPVSPAMKGGWKDVFIRAPWWAMDTRPPGLRINDKDRAGAINHSHSPKKRNEDK